MKRAMFFHKAQLSVGTWNWILGDICIDISDFTVSNFDIKGNDGFYTENIAEVPNNVRYKQKSKFADKVLLWCAISTRGISRPYVGRGR